MDRRHFIAYFVATAPIIAASSFAFLAASPAAAQFSDSYKFLKAVRDGDGAEATKSLQNPSSTFINTKDYGTGEGALHIVAKRRDLTWLTFLLSKGADPNIRDNNGNTPMIISAQLGFPEGVEALLAQGASIDQANNSGETALIIATQQRNVPMVRTLISNGADPKKPDRIAGKSAHDYAAEDARGSAILKILDEAKPVKTKSKMQGPGL